MQPFFRTIKTVLPALFTALAVLLPATAAGDALSGFGSVLDPGIETPNRKSGELQHARADNWRLSGRTLFVDGNVFIPYGNVLIHADSAMIDLESRDIEAKGNISFAAVKRNRMSVTVDELERLLEVPEVLCEILGTEIDPLGRQKIKVEIISRGSALKAERMSGNLLSGNITFTDITMQVKNFICKAERGIRQPGGEIRLEKLEVSSCEYLREDQAHLSFSMNHANIYPHETDGFGFSNMEKDYTEYSMWGYNGFLRIYGVPVLWLPMLYTPKDESPGLFQMQLGYNSDWGAFGLFSKKYQLMDYPYVSARLHLDWYSLRGLGYGVGSTISTENTRTELFAYGIHDKRPYQSSSDKPWRKNSTARLNIPEDRFDFRLTHMTHLTPRLDFRAQVEWLSDAYMLDDYFNDRADSLSEPASYLALEYQGDRYSASLYTRFQVNDFYTTLQKLPEARLDMPRQEIIPGWNLYYQGSHTADYMRMNWARFDRKPKNPDGRLKNYQAGRFDSVNFLYFPLRTDYFNIVPRAGLRLTGYTNSSKNEITQDEIFAMQVAADPDDDLGIAVHNYDDSGSGKFRLAAEFGAEANTKIYGTWQNIRNSFWELDGLRHVCEPYINYTFITDPTVNRDKLLFFDDIDRITELNFIRFGLRNRLQTRRGGFQNGSIHEWFAMENYWDIYFNDDDNYNHIGDFCTKLTFNPTKQFSFSGFMSIDAGNNQAHDLQAIRGNREAGRPGIGGTFFNRLYFQLMYKPIEDVSVSLTYDYKDGYIGRAAYSMGSTLSEIDSGSAFDQFYLLDRTQTITFGLTAPLTPDRRTFGAYSISYDIEDGGFSRQALGISRLFHCVKLSALVEFERERDDGEIKYDTSFAVYATLVGLEGPMNAVNRSAMANFARD